MTRRILIPVLLLTLLPLAGCGIPGGIAYAIKATNNSNSSSGQTAQPASQPAAAQQQAEEPPPPAPEAAPRDSIEVEQLPAPTP